MPKFQVGDRVRTVDCEFYEAGQIVGTVEWVGPDDVLIRLSPDCPQYAEAWYSEGYGYPGKFWYTNRSWTELDGPPNTTQAMSRLIVAELTK